MQNTALIFLSILLIWKAISKTNFKRQIQDHQERNIIEFASIKMTLNVRKITHFAYYFCIS